VGTLSLIVLLPLAGFLLNGLLATRLSGHRSASARHRRRLRPADPRVPGRAPALVELQPAATCRCRGGLHLGNDRGEPFEIAFHFDRLTAVMVLIVTGVAR